MYHGGIARAHGGQGATAGAIAATSAIEAVFRGTTQTIRVWQGFGDAEEFTIDEARALCARGDQALMLASPSRRADLMFDTEQGTLLCLTLPRPWLIGFLAAMRRALRTADTARLFSRKPYRDAAAVDGDDGAPAPACIDSDSDPGSWNRHLLHTASMRGGVADSS